MSNKQPSGALSPGDAVQQRWGGTEFANQLDNAFWMNHSVVRGYLNQLATGSPQCDWLTWFWREWLRPAKPVRVLVLGCGEGWLERAVARLPNVEHIDAIDVAAEAVERAENAAEAAGISLISYHVADLNEASLDPNAYDVVLAHSVLHHLENLEHVLEAIRSSLRPGGWLAINEFVGPAHLQFDDRVLGIVNRLMLALPDRLRRSTLFDATYDLKQRPDLDQMIEDDPSEGVRAPELDGLIRDAMTIEYEAPMGGTILQLLLWDLVANFSEDSPLDRCLLERLCQLEETLISEAGLPSDYRLYFCRAEDGAGSEARPKRMTASSPGAGTPPIATPIGALGRAPAAASTARVSRRLTERATRAIAQAKPRIAQLLSGEASHHAESDSPQPLIWLGGPKEFADGLVQSFPRAQPTNLRAAWSILWAGTATLCIARPRRQIPERKLRALCCLFRKQGQLLHFDPTGLQAPQHLLERFTGSLPATANHREEHHEARSTTHDRAELELFTGGSLLHRALAVLDPPLDVDQQGEVIDLVAGIEEVLEQEGLLPPSTVVRVLPLRPARKPW